MTATRKKSKNPKKILGERVLAVDVDDTLVLWNASSAPGSSQEFFSPENRVVTLHQHTKNINLVEKFYKLGYTILVWSGSGVDWAETVCTQLGIDYMVTNYMTKPGFMLDDQPVKNWSRRLWRNPSTGRNGTPPPDPRQ